MLELILSTESRVLSTNLQTFEQQANQYLQTLTQKFETDEDFAAAKEEVKELKAIENKINTAIDNVLNDSQAVSELIDTAKGIAERFRQERLNREKLVKAKEAEVKKAIVDVAIDAVFKVRNGYESTISLALERRLPKAQITARLQEATKSARSLNGLQKAVNAEKGALLEEIALQTAELSTRLKQIPIAYEHLFKDTVNLIAGNDELEPIVQQRIAEEQQREAEIKAKAEKEALEAQQAAKEPLPQQASEPTEPSQQAVHSEQHFAKTENAPATAETFNFMLQIPFTGTVEQAREYFSPVKAIGYDGIKLTKLAN